MLLLRSFKNKILNEVYLGINDKKISLKKKNIETIGVQAFASKYNLEEIILPDTLKRIETQAFVSCYDLKKVILPEGITNIGEYAFSHCTSLEEINLPNSIEVIGRGSFCSCEKLKNVKLPENLDEIQASTFEKCLSLEEIIIPEGVKVIEESAFFYCPNLKCAELPASLIIADDPFFHCENLEKIVIKDWRILLNNTIDLGLNNILNYVYLNKKTNEMIISSNKLDNSNYIEFNLKELEIHPSIVHEEWRNYLLFYILSNDIINSNQEIDDILMDLIRYDLNKDNYELALKDINNKDKFMKLIKYFNKKLTNDKLNYKLEYAKYELFKLAYSLGAFSDNEIERQRACEFIKNMNDKCTVINIRNLHAHFESMKVNGFNKDFADFIMTKGNIEKLEEIEKEETGFIARIYNSFDGIKEFGRSNRGNQRYRKVTVEMCQDYLKHNLFIGIDGSNIDISETIKEYTNDQTSFNKAIVIRKEYLKLKESKKISDHLLNEELKEVREEILKNTSDTLSNLNELSNNKFTYEFLSKYDPRNFVLGKYCSCCAHLEGVGSSIMKASILHPDCQNLVIKDETGKIIAKSTLYINREQGYGVFNNVEIHESIDKEMKKQIYIKYKEAIKAFAKRYNELNPRKPLKQINVGMRLNDLDTQIRGECRKSIILEGINFSKYGGYGGDWKEEQYMIWKNKK